MQAKKNLVFSGLNFYHSGPARGLPPMLCSYECLDYQLLSIESFLGELRSEGKNKYRRLFHFEK